MNDEATQELIQAKVREARAKIAARASRTRLLMDTPGPRPSRGDRSTCSKAEDALNPLGAAELAEVTTDPPKPCNLTVPRDELRALMAKADAECDARIAGGDLAPSPLPAKLDKSPSPVRATRQGGLRRVREAMIALTVIGVTFAVVSVTISACSGGAKVGARDELPPPATVKPQQEALTQTTKELREDTKAIATVAEDGRKNVPELEVGYWGKILSTTAAMLVRLGTLDNTATDLGKTQDAIEARDRAHVEAEKAQAGVIVEKEKQIEKLKSDAGKWERFAWSLFIVFGGIALVASPVIAYITKVPGAGVTVAIAGIGAIAVGTFMRDFDWVIGTVIAGLVVLCGVALGLAIWARRRKDWSKALSKARFYRDAVDPRQPESIREVVAAERREDPLVDKAMEELKEEPKPRKPKPAPVYAEPPPPPGEYAPA